MTEAAAYRERSRLIAFIAGLYASSLEKADPSPGFQYVLYVDSPAGQLSWHISDDDLDLFALIPANQGRRWDGSSDTYLRLDAISGALRSAEDESQRLLNRLGGGAAVLADSLRKWQAKANAREADNAALRLALREAVKKPSTFHNENCNGIGWYLYADETGCDCGTPRLRLFVGPVDLTPNMGSSVIQEGGG